jgi:hypothetical protein
MKFFGEDFLKRDPLSVLFSCLAGQALVDCCTRVVIDLVLRIEVCKILSGDAQPSNQFKATKAMLARVLYILKKFCAKFLLKTNSLLRFN